MTSLKLNIDFGNAAMTEPEDAAEAMRLVVSQLESGNTSGYVRDANGNTVGFWEIS